VKRLVFPFFFFLFVVFGNFACLKSSDNNCNPKTPSSKASAMNAFCPQNGITPTAHSSGLFYQILDPGTGATPSATSKIAITYTGKLLDGQMFDQRTTPNNVPGNGPDSPWSLSQLIEGWQVGIPLIKEGGHILLVVPSSMAYGCQGYGAIPANSILYFDITLVDVQ